MDRDGPWRTNEVGINVLDTRARGTWGGRVNGTAPRNLILRETGQVIRRQRGKGVPPMTVVLDQ